MRVQRGVVSYSRRCLSVCVSVKSRITPRGNKKREPGTQVRLEREHHYTPGSDEHGPGFNRGSGGGARGCDFEERVGAYARTYGGRFI